jgi:hypothetical protein
VKTRISFVILLCCLLSTVAGNAQQENPHNGFWWIRMSENFKLGFVTGYAKAMTTMFDAGTLACLVEKGDEAMRSCVQTKMVPFDFAKIQFVQFSEGLDEFYKDFRNKAIDVDFGIRYVRDQLKNKKSAKELDEELSNYRSLSH